MFVDFDVFFRPWQESPLSATLNRIITIVIDWQRYIILIRPQWLFFPFAHRWHAPLTVNRLVEEIIVIYEDVWRLWPDLKAALLTLQKKAWGLSENISAVRSSGCPCHRTNGTDGRFKAAGVLSWAVHGCLRMRPGTNTSKEITQA